MSGCKKDERVETQAGVDGIGVFDLTNDPFVGTLISCWTVTGHGNDVTQAERLTVL